MKKKEPSHGARHGQRKLSTREIVAATNLSPQRVLQRLKRGETGEEIVAAVTQRKQSEATALAEENAHRSRTSSTAPAPLSFSVRKKAEADAELKVLEVRVRRGQLVPVSQVSIFMGGCIIKAREIWLAIPNLVPQIRQCDDPIAAQHLIDAEIRRGLAELEKFGEMMAGRTANGGRDGSDGDA